MRIAQSHATTAGRIRYRSTHLLANCDHCTIPMVLLDRNMVDIILIISTIRLSSAPPPSDRDPGTPLLYVPRAHRPAPTLQSGPDFRKYWGSTIIRKAMNQSGPDF